MADTQTREALLTIRVDNGEAIKAIGKYQQEIAKCTEVITSYQQKEKEGQKLSEQERNDMNQNIQVQKSLQKQMREVEYQYQKSLQKQTENEGSLKSLRGELSNLTNQYDKLSRTEREGAKGKELQEHISQVYNELKKAEEGTGRFQRNVGNYTNQMVSGFGAVGGAAGSMINPIKNATAGLKAMSSTPIIAVLGLLINIISKVISSMKNSEQTMNSVQAALVPLNALSTLFTRTMDMLAKGVAKVAEKLGSWLSKLKIIKDEITEEQAITKAEIALQKERRRVAEANAQTELEVAELRAKTAEKDKYSNAERIKMLEQVVEKEREAAERTKNLAKEELRVAEARAALTENSVEDEDRLSQLRVAAINAETQYNAKIREINAQLSEARRAQAKEQQTTTTQVVSTEQKATKDLEKEVEKRIAIRQQEIETRLKLVEKGSQEELQLQQDLLTAKYAQEMRSLEQQEGTEQLRMLKKQEYDAQMLALEESYWEDFNAMLTQEMDAFIAAQVAETEAVEEASQREQEAKIAAANAIGNAMGNLSNLAEQFADENKALAKASKVLALAQIAIETGVATAKGISQSQSVPFPANIAAIATTIATIVGGIASAVASVKSAKFAKGGLVVGEGTGTSDSIPARLSNGESVITAQATSMFSPLLSALNQMGGGNAIDVPGSNGTLALEQAIARGMRAAQLSVSVTEIDRVRDRMDNINAIAQV